MFDREQYNIVFDYLKSRYGVPIGEGRHRITFESKYCVVKLPHNMEGCHSNLHEAFCYNNNISERDRLAKCKIVNFYCFPLLIMQKLNLDFSWTEHPSWASYYDCHQVGRSRRGDWKAYDYGL